LILAALNIDGETTLRLPQGSRDHTEKALLSLGAQLRVESRGSDEWIAVKGPFRPQPKDFQVPGDPSSAAFFCVLGAIRPEGEVTIQGVLNNPTRTGFLQVLNRMGLKISQVEGISQVNSNLVEPVMDLKIQGGQTLTPVDVEPALIPKLIDEIPILAVAASFAPGISRFRSIAELRVKESDRLQKTIELINSAGQGRKAWADGDDLLVQGTPTPPDGFQYDPDQDHRMAMAASILAKVARSPCRIQDPQCVVVSFPEFFNFLGESFDET
jgi:3-phosphoshikimate 1-carboxyvinyltransferase